MTKNALIQANKIYRKAVAKAEKKIGSTETEAEFRAYVEEISAALGMEKNWNHQYTITELSAFEVMPVKNHRSIQKLVADKKLRATVFGKGKNTRYLVRVRNVIAYLDSVLQTVSTM